MPATRQVLGKEYAYPDDLTDFGKAQGNSGNRSGLAQAVLGKVYHLAV